MLFINSLCSFCTSPFSSSQSVCAALCVGVVFAHVFLCLFSKLLFIYFFASFHCPSIVSRKHETTCALCKHAQQTCSQAWRNGGAKAASRRASQHTFLILLLHVRAPTLDANAPRLHKITMQMTPGDVALKVIASLRLGVSSGGLVASVRGLGSVRFASVKRAEHVWLVGWIVILPACLITGSMWRGDWPLTPIIFMEICTWKRNSATAVTLQLQCGAIDPAGWNDA